LLQAYFRWDSLFYLSARRAHLSGSIRRNLQMRMMGSPDGYG